MVGLVVYDGWTGRDGDGVLPVGLGGTGLATREDGSFLQDRLPACGRLVLT
jgi:hypothetical protein